MSLIPTPSALDIADDNQQTAVKEVLTSIYKDAGNWTVWGATLLDGYMTKVENLLGSDTVEADLAAMIAEMGDIVESNPGTINGAGAGFTDTLLDSLRTRLSADIQTRSTGLGDAAEEAIFARETARVTAINTKAYKEITTTFSSRGFDQPPGAMDAKIAEASIDAAAHLTESSGKITEESSRLALDYNKSVLNSSAQLLDLLSRVYESEEMRKFEASKATVLMAVENYKSYLGLASTKAELAIKKASVVLDNKNRQLTLEVQSLIALAGGAQQIIAGALNGVSVSSSFGFSGSTSMDYSIANNTSDTYKEGDHANPSLPRL